MRTICNERVLSSACAIICMCCAASADLCQLQSSPQLGLPSAVTPVLHTCACTCSLEPCFNKFLPQQPPTSSCKASHHHHAGITLHLVMHNTCYMLSCNFCSAGIHLSHHQRLFLRRLTTAQASLQHHLTCACSCWSNLVPSGVCVSHHQRLPVRPVIILHSSHWHTHSARALGM
jgi:hypothetical protein